VNDLRLGLQAVFDGLYLREFNHYPAPIEHKQMQLLVGVCDKSTKSTALFSADSTLVRHVEKERVIGSGELLKDLAHEFQIMKLRLSQGIWIAMYLVWTAKQRFEGIGGDPLILGIKESGELVVERIWDIADKERMLDRIDKCRNQLLIMLDSQMPRHVVKARLKFVTGAIMTSRQQLTVAHS
jgi:hypothetical protein